jgi:hypothetical protein
MELEDQTAASKHSIPGPPSVPASNLAHKSIDDKIIQTLLIASARANHLYEDKKYKYKSAHRGALNCDLHSVLSDSDGEDKDEAPKKKMKA